MKDKLEQLYGEYMQLKDGASDYLVKQKYQEKINALDKLFETMPYGFPNPANEN